MRAVVLAAGRGSRLGELTRDTPKPLLCVGGQPLIARVLGGIAAAGIEEVAVITGYLGETLRDRMGNGAALGIRISWFAQAALDGTARALSLAREFTSGEPFLYAWGDVVVQPENYRACVEALVGVDGVLAVNELDDPAAGAAVYLDGPGFVERIVEKPPPGTSTTRWNNAGIGVLPPSIWPEIDALEPSPRGEYELPQAIGSLISRGCRVRAVPIRGPWFDIGTPESLSAAHAAMGDA